MWRGAPLLGGYGYWLTGRSVGGNRDEGKKTPHGVIHAVTGANPSSGPSLVAVALDVDDHAESLRRWRRRSPLGLDPGEPTQVVVEAAGVLELPDALDA